MKRIEFIQRTDNRKIGDVVTVSDVVAKILVKAGKAKYVTETIEAEEKPAPKRKRRSKKQDKDE
ncbi:hypothetical protein HOP61_13315 [Halomonas daqingensis]|uniref:Uncharacterized protein n=1 Tax=Billgrantia desiderata TaxID=52021 RepID=A0AAW4YTP0_9GAMM|nr:hypothetical protein [Halomonas desiderata]MCE8052284.1 hypothetical protein [Halomonas desiderata]